MKLSCLQENLNKGISMVGRLVATRGTLEILSHILITTEGGRLKLSATNLEIGINYKIGAKIEKEGGITVPARLFSEFVSQLPEGKIVLEVKNDTLYSSIGEFKSSIKGQPVDEFPLIPKIKSKKTLSLKSGELKEAAGLVSFAAALDDVRPVLSGIYLKTEKDKLVLAATNSYRLAEKIINLNVKDMAKKEVIVPARSMIELARALDEPEKEVNIYLDETQIIFETTDIEFTSRLIEGQFPDYKQIIPSEPETKAVASLSELAGIIRVASLFSKEAAGSVTLEVRKKGKIEAISAATQYGDSNASCPADVTGKDAEIVFNSQYILDVLNNLSGGNVSLELSGKLNPGVIRREGDKSYIYVIMPLRA